MEIATNFEVIEFIGTLSQSIGQPITAHVLTNS